MPNFQYKSEKKYKVCFLGYSHLTEIAREVIDSLPETDVEYVLMECSLESQEECIKEARQLGCEIFVGGGGNIAKFINNYNWPMVEIQITNMDYALAVRNGIDHGCRKIAIARHHLSPPVDIDIIENLLNTKVDEIVFENSSDMYDLARKTDSDAIIGASLAVDAAVAAGKMGILLYSSKEAIRDACLRAGELAHNLREIRRNREITRALVNNAQFGIIVTDENGIVQMFNRTAQRYTGVAPTQIRNHPITDFFPRLSVSPLLKSNQLRMDSHRLIGGNMTRCMQEKILIDNKTIGVLITLYPDPHNRRKTPGESYDYHLKIYKWEDIITESDIMKQLVDQGRSIAKLDYNTVIVGDSGSGREAIAHCLHSSSQRANEPCVTINMASFSEEDASRILFGYERQDCSVAGILTSANGGSVIIQNISLAKPAVRESILMAATSKQMYRPGTSAPQKFDIVFYTIVTEKELENLPPVLKSALSVCEIRVPSICDRVEDIGKLFTRHVSNITEMPKRIILTEQMLELLNFYSWPGNIQEINTVSIRFSVLMSQMDKPSQRSKYICLMKAIGEENVFNEVIKKYPALMQRPVENKEEFADGIYMLKKLMKYSNDEIAEKLLLSRTTIWRIVNDAEEKFDK